MPRDSNGNYSNIGLYGNPVVTSTPIAITWWNQTNADYSTAMTDSLSRSGLGGMLVPFKLVNGSAGAPAFSFENESNTGFYLATAGEMDVSVGGTRLSRWTSAGFQESFDNGSTWKTPVYLDVASQSMGSTGALDFAAGKLTIGSVVVKAVPVVTRSTTSTGTFSTASGTFTAVTNANISFTATGRPVFVQLVPDDTSNASYLFGAPTGAVPALGTIGSPDFTLALSADGGSTFFALERLFCLSYSNGVFWVPSTYQCSAYSTWYTPSTGAATLGLYVLGASGTTTAHVLYSKLSITQF